MNKYFAWLPAFLLLGAVVYKPVKQAYEIKPVEKNISFTVYKGHNYSSTVYGNTYVEIHIIVEKVNTKGERKIVWEKIMDPKMLTEYPTTEQALKQAITISNVNEKKEHFEVRYILTYNSEGSELQMQDGTVVPGSGSSKVDITI